MRVKIKTLVEKVTGGYVSNHAEIPSWIANFEDCCVCGDPITLEHCTVIANIDFDDGHGEKMFFHKECFLDATKRKKR